MNNINKIALVVGIFFAVVDALCALLIAAALQPFLSVLRLMTHLRFTGVGVESDVTLVTVIGGMIATFVLGYLLTWFFVVLCKKFCLKECCKEEKK